MFKCISQTTGKSLPAKVIKETKCYYTFEVANYYSNGKSLVERVHKNTMFIEWLFLQFVEVEEPTPAPEEVEDNYKAVVIKALSDEHIYVCVGDQNELNDDLVNSRDINAIVEACEATDAPVITFNLKVGIGHSPLGSMSVMVGYGDESIIDHHSNEFMNRITEGAY